MKETTQSNKSHPNKKHSSHKRYWGSRRSRGKGRRREGEITLTIVRPGRKKPIPLTRSSYRPEKKPPRIPYQPTCPICEKKILSSSSIVDEPGSSVPAHFECVLQKISEKVSLGEHQRLSYLGSGVFAVIEPSDPSKKNSPFKIVQQVHTSQKSSETQWKGSLAITPRYIIHVEKTTLQMKEEMAELERMSIKPTENADFMMLENDN